MTSESEEYAHKINELEQINLILKELMKKEKLSSQIMNPVSLNLTVDELESAGIISSEFIDLFKKNHKNYSKEMITEMHDKLRNPLVPIIGYTDMMLSGMYGELDLEQLARIKIVNENAKILHNILRSMLDDKK